VTPDLQQINNVQGSWGQRKGHSVKTSSDGQIIAPFWKSGSLILTECQNFDWKLTVITYLAKTTQINWFAVLRSSSYSIRNCDAF